MCFEVQKFDDITWIFTHVCSVWIATACWSLTPMGITSPRSLRIWTRLKLASFHICNKNKLAASLIRFVEKTVVAIDFCVYFTPDRVFILIVCLFFQYSNKMPLFTFFPRVNGQIISCCDLLNLLLLRK